MKPFALLVLAALLASCDSNYGSHRGYVISKSQQEIPSNEEVQEIEALNDHTIRTSD